MSQVFTFRVVPDIEETVFRDIEILEHDTFENLHKSIQDAFSFDGSQMASFYMSNDDWDKGQEITLMKMDFDDGSSSLEMNHTPLNALIEDEGDKMVYVFDFMLMWCFFIEVVSVKNSEGKEYPVCSNSFGKAPDQYSKEIDLSDEDDKYLLKNKGKIDEDDFDEEFEELPSDI